MKPDADSPNVGGHNHLIGHQEAAAYFDVPAATLHNWNSRGIGPRSYRIGKYRKYRIADLDEFIERKASDAGEG